MKVYNRFKPDRIVTGPNTRGIAEALGAAFEYPDSGVPYAGEPLLTCASDVYKLKQVQDFSEYETAAKILRSLLPWWTRTEMSIGGPFTIASMLTGTEKLLRACRKDSAAVHHMLKVITNTQKKCIDIAAKCDCGIAMADPVANPELIGPRMYEEFVFPYTMELAEYTIETSGKRVSMHMCGRTYSIWTYLQQYPLGELSLDNCIDISRAADELGQYVRIAGNVDPVGVILNGKREEIDNAVRECIRAGGRASKGFTLATGCDVPETADPVKIEWFMESARKYGLEL